MVSDAEAGYDELLAYVKRLEIHIVTGGARYRNRKRIQAFVEAPEWLKIECVAVTRSQTED